MTTKKKSELAVTGKILISILDSHCEKTNYALIRKLSFGAKAKSKAQKIRAEHQKKSGWGRGAKK